MKENSEPNQTINQLFQRYQENSEMIPLNQSQLFDEKISCIQTYKNFLYLGTNESKVLVFQISKTKLKDRPLAFAKTNQFYPYCTSVQLIKAFEQFLIVIPHQEQRLIRIWNRQKIEIIQGFKGHLNKITQVLYLKDKMHLASASFDSTARIWNIYQKNQFDKEKSLFESFYPILTIEQIDQSLLAIGGDDCCITIWNWQKLQTECVVFGHPGSVYSLTLYYPFLVSSGGDSKIKIWSIRKQTMQTSPKSITQYSLQTKQDLKLVKQIEGQVGQKQFFFKLPNYKMLILDSSGKASMINDQFELSTLQLQAQYFQSIMSASVWEDYLFFICADNTINKKNPLKIFKLIKSHEEQLINVFFQNDIQIQANDKDFSQQKGKLYAFLQM